MSRGADLIVRAWARLTALGGRAGGADRLDLTDSAAFDDAARAAYRESATIKAARAPNPVGAPIDAEGAARRPLADESAVSEWHRARRVPSFIASSASAGPASVLVTSDPDSGTPADLASSGAGLAVGGDDEPAQADAGDLAVQAAPDEVAPTPTERATPRRGARDTAPRTLLRTPSNVNPVTDEFFDSLIRRVEGDR